ncbi:MAG TPA: glycosyltransferase family 4 protein [Hanamia sp.]|nr:glycosyltransferase family 4 protein [Hanamia sp.]
MRILFFINGIHPGGKERRMIELMKELKLRKEIDFELVLMNREINYPEILKMDIKLHYLIRKSKKDLSIFRKFYKICKEFRPEIIHCWDSMTAVYAIPASKLLNIKLMNGMVVDTPVKKNIFNKNWLRAQLTFPFSDIIIGNSKAGLYAYKAPAKKSECIYNGVDLTRFTNLIDPSNIRKEIFGNDLGDIFIVGMVAAFEERKDYKTLIGAAMKLIPNNNRLRFVLVGGGILLNEIKSTVPAPFLDKIFFLGNKSKVENIINIFDVGVLLTNAKIHGEGISNSIIEYMALGKPVIATRGGGTNEVVFDNQNGYLIEAKSTDHLIQKIEKIIKDENRGKLGEKGRQMVNDKFDLKIMTGKYIDFYQRITKKKEKYEYSC